jgi:hypothetical protein
VPGTTATECAIGLRRPDAGTIRLLGLDPHADPDQVHEIVGVQLQSASSGAAPARVVFLGRGVFASVSASPAG